IQYSFFIVRIRRHPSSTLFPYTTLFRSAPSTNALASFRPRPVASRTTLITLIFESPAEVNSTSNSDFSSAAASPAPPAAATGARSEEHTSELQSRENLVCRLLLEKKKLS